MLTATTGLSSKTATNGATTTYTYDRYGNVLTMTDALGHTETNTYSNLGKLTSKVDRKGNTTSYTYDVLGRPLTVTSGTDSLTYKYTKTGQIWSERNGTQKTIYTYDSLGRVIKVREAGPNASETEQYTVTLNANGGVVFPSMVTVTYGDTYNLPTPTKAGATFFGWYYNGTWIHNGDTVAITSNCTFTAYWSDSGIMSTEPGAEIQMVINPTFGDGYIKTYTYDLAGNRTGFTLTEGITTLQSVTYTYDDLNRLYQVKEDNTVAATYAYDTNGNRASLTYANGNTTTCTLAGSVMTATYADKC